MVEDKLERFRHPIILFRIPLDTKEPTVGTVNNGNTPTKG